MNIGDLSRKEAVLKYLQDRIGEWVDGPELANAEVGGSEGLKRLRELRADGHPIRTRRHPDPARDIWQYQYARVDKIVPPPIRKDEPKPSRESRYEQRPAKLVFGVMRPCPRCNAISSKGCLRCNGIGVIPV